MKKLAQKRKRVEKLLRLSIACLVLALCLLFITVLTVLYEYYPGNPDQDIMIWQFISAFILSVCFGFLTAKALYKYRYIQSLIDLYKQGQKNKMTDF